MSELNVANRTLAIMDNLAFLCRLNNEYIDLIAIDSPFAANETFTGNPRPPISDAEFAEEIALAQAHGFAQRAPGLTVCCVVAVPRYKDLADWGIYREVGAGELDAGPLSADEPGFGDGYQLADVPAVHFHQRGAVCFQVGRCGVSNGLGRAVRVQHAVGVLPQADESGAMFRGIIA